MKKLISCLFFIGVISVTSGQIKPDFSRISDHPRLLLRQGEEEKLKEGVLTHTAWRNLHEVILRESTAILDMKPLTRNQIGRRILQTSREALRRIFYLSYSWRMTEERSYLEKAEQELLAVSQFADWNPSHFLDVAEMTLATAIGYDWLYHELPEASRQTIRNAILQKGLAPGQDAAYNGWRRAKNNWNQVCNTGLSFGALAVFEENEALCNDIIEKAIASIRIPMEAYAPAGNYTEGYSYWAYGTSFNVLFIDMLEKAFGSDFGLSSQPGFLQTASFYANLMGTSGRVFNYGDAGGVEGLQPAMFWFANKLQDRSVLFIEKDFLERQKFNEKSNRLLPLAMLWADGIDVNKIQAPTTKLWHATSENEIAVLRTGWNKTKDIYVGFKGGTASVSHGHMDAGSFVLDMDGVRWASELGMQQYNSLESAGLKIWDMHQQSPRWDVFRLNNFSHNTLTINGQLHQMEGNAKLIKKSENEEQINAVFDLTSVFASQLEKATRGIAVLNKSYVIVRDEIKTGKNRATVRWAMLTPARVDKIDGNRLVLKNGKKKITVFLEDMDDIQWKSWSAEPPKEYDAPNPGFVFVGFEIQMNPHEVKHLNISFNVGDHEKRSGHTLALSEW
ncbi:heparinase II/III domain-containing protein [Sphingobacterium chuzhouense]|uniref:Heparinase II/III family protein n=1 Tax=Sphingobacterium chuzhouense TaxID=1742264 RepID=A0ABR7XNT5_9SPHI|nr:heparinase II/III family protein [Sphingobacterium chuzhouense]MBD1420839.1 heparinase II/III family protein [Sphingobacterium chuzhouense]